MKKSMILKRILHREKSRLAIIFDYDSYLAGLVRTIEGVAWSQTHKCWYASDDEEHLRQILTIFREKAQIDITAISGGIKDEPVYKYEIPPGDLDAGGHIPEIKAEKKTQVSSFKSPAVKEEQVSAFDPVLFTISEADGRLVVRFTGRYDAEWIKELRTYGKPWYDNVTHEWHLRWAQLAVDSLSDYFSTRGVKVIVKKKEVPVVIREIRNEQGNEVRERNILRAAEEGIENVRRSLEEERYSRRTIEAYVAGMELFFRYHNRREPDDITEEDISGFIEDHILKLGYSASYQNIIISAIKNYYKINGNRRIDTDSLKRPKRSRALPKVFSKEEIMDIFAATKNNKHKLILWLIYSCGLRRSEVINIKLTDLDTDRGVLHIREGKGNVDRMVPIPQKVWEKIRAYIKGYKPREYLFEGQTGGRYSVESVYAVFKHSLKLAGIKKEVGVHCLRHSYATHLHEGGLDIRYIQELLGHKSSRTTEIYTHVSRRNLFAIRSPIEDMDLE